ncbi:MAG: tetratricopeptide repeat protein [Phaeodactylibacter sp.]|nr:tetratricopeptide repeat protein [Phaeodactylibacter sp.]
MDQKTLTDELKRLISEGELRKAIDRIFQYIGENKGIKGMLDLEDDVVILSNRLGQLEKKEMLGTASGDEIRIERARINQSLLLVIRNISNPSKGKKAREKEPPPLSYGQEGPPGAEEPIVLLEKQSSAPEEEEIEVSEKAEAPGRKEVMPFHFRRRHFVAAAIFALVVGVGVIWGIWRWSPKPSASALSGSAHQKLLETERAILKNDTALASSSLIKTLALVEGLEDSTLVLSHIADLYLEKEAFKDAHHIISQLNVIAHKAGAPLYRLEAENKLSRALIEEGRHRESKEHLIHAKERASEISESTPASRFLNAQTYLLLGIYYLEEKSLASAQNQLDRAQKMIANAGRRTPDYYLLLGNIQFSYGRFYLEKGLPDKATELYQAAIRSFEKHLERWEGSEHATRYYACSGMAMARNNLANLYRNKEDLNLRVAYLKEAEQNFDDLEKAGFHNFQDETARVKYNMASSLYRNGELDKALFEYKGLLAKFEHLNKTDGGKYNDAIAICHNAIGGIYLLQENYKEAVRYFLQSKKIREEMFSREGEQHREGLANVYYNLAEAYASAGKTDLARTYYEKAIQNFDELYQNNKRAHYFNYSNVLFGYAKLLLARFDGKVSVARARLKMARDVLYENGADNEEEWKELADSIKAYQDKFSGS